MHISIRRLRFRQNHFFYSFSNVLSVTTLTVNVLSVTTLTVNVLSVTTLTVKELFYIDKIQFFTAVSKSIITYITLIVSNISNNIIKQYYRIIKTFKVLIIVKKKTLIFLFKTGLSRLISKLSLISRIYLLWPYAKMVNSSKNGIFLQIRRWSRILLSFDGLTFLNVKVDIPICSPDLTFKCLSVSP